MVPWKNQNLRTWRRRRRIILKLKRMEKSQHQTQNQHGQASVSDPRICSNFIGQSSLFRLADEFPNIVGVEEEIVVGDNLTVPPPPTANDGHLEAESHTIDVAGSSDDELNPVANPITGINWIIIGIFSKVVIKTFAHDLVFSLWINVLTSLSEKEMLEFIKFPTRLLHDAARAGNVEFLIELISFYPDIGSYRS